ncbi:MAG: DUF2807 domain-containing protein [Bacteroidaceae bacterium]|nr:DUF2807 domain-containing protein [Bacteroidaceae bacterium]
MKNQYLLPLLTLFILTACHNAPEKNQHQKAQQEEKQQDKKKVNIIRKPLSIPYEFSYITNLGSVDIFYSQGDYNIDVEGDSSMLQHLDADFDSGLLSVSIKTDRNNGVNLFGSTSNVRMYVSSPVLHCISVCGSSSFENTSTWKGENLRIGALGTGALKLGRVECETAIIESNNIGGITIDDLQAHEATIYSRSSANINVNLNVDELTVLNEGKQSITLTGSAKKTLIKNPDDEKLTNNLK